MKLKLDKYEIKFDKKEDKIDIESLDGWVTFLVNLLEEYWKRLEEDVKREKDRELEEGEWDSSLIDYDDSEVYKQLTKQNSI